jgi:integrase
VIAATLMTTTQAATVRGAFLGSDLKTGLAGLRFHDLRASSAAALVATGVDVKTRTRHTGHRRLSGSSRQEYQVTRTVSVWAVGTGIRTGQIRGRSRLDDLARLEVGDTL